MTGIAAAASLALLEIPYPHIDPVAIDLPGPLDVRWYGLGYMVGFGAAYLLLRRLARSGFLRLEPDAIGDLIFALVLGVILGGRIGYILFYDFPRFAAHPLDIFKIWTGGLAFHGGMVGAILAGAWFARKQRVPWKNVGDGLALAVTPGIFAVRIANFINGELYGRIADASVPWAMRFPTDPKAAELLGAGGGLREREIAIDRAYDSGMWDRVKSQVPLRHPSQLYEALGEGAFTGMVVWGVFLWNRRRGVRWGDGAYGGLFLVCYGLVRTFLELFRQPDAQFTGNGDTLGTVLGPLTMGQVLSLLTALVGLFFLIRGIRTPPEEVPSAKSPVPSKSNGGTRH
ncbi:prolipoprotein diacylglyceryl transferase [Longimicrobium sp.]|uniref:prolipoprotein diacylglyceryl transferase n=1 Tax=Longimicrobium sp. TaxID=2029185 RepID=UPI002B610085|nr:prolipoprotein diacylglyceryl transferase [Longimicrobium sp.]HSU12705.1 prolipoprotein diacylglyceryl transferase [Longimicrobium sp.]